MQNMEHTGLTPFEGAESQSEKELNGIDLSVLPHRSAEPAAQTEGGEVAPGKF